MHDDDVHAIFLGLGIWVVRMGKNAVGWIHICVCMCAAVDSDSGGVSQCWDFSVLRLERSTIVIVLFEWNQCRLSRGLNSRTIIVAIFLSLSLSFICSFNAHNVSHPPLRGYRRVCAHTKLSLSLYFSLDSAPFCLFSHSVWMRLMVCVWFRFVYSHSSVCFRAFLFSYSTSVSSHTTFVHTNGKLSELKTI